jgi:fructose-1,6-bisphosphatase I
MTQRISLTRYLVEQQRVDGLIPSQLRLLLEVVARASKSISQAVNKEAGHHRQRGADRGQ